MTSVDPIFIYDSREVWFPVGVEETFALFNVDIRNGTINFANDMVQPDLPPVVYKRSLKGGPLNWTQWWLWYLYNPGPPIQHGVGRHEGDWEYVQIGSDSENVLMTCSQHHSGGKREYWTVELQDDRPVVYVNLGSHANSFTRGHHNIDICDGKGKVLSDYEIRDFGDWAKASGKWGNSDNSPTQLSNRRTWKRPHIAHSKATNQ
jgi:hypothetical protein